MARDRGRADRDSPAGDRLTAGHRPQPSRRPPPARATGPYDTDDHPRRTPSPSTTRPSATAPRARTSRSRSPTSCASRACSTSTAFPFIEGGWPGSNPKDIEFFAAARKDALAARAAGRLRQHAPPGEPARGRPEPARARRRRDAGRHDLRQELAAARHRGAGRDAGREPGHDRGLGRASSSTRAARPSTTRSTSSTATGRTATTRCRRCGPRAQAGARTLVLCDTNGGTLTGELVDDRRRRPGARSRATPDAPAVTWGIHTHNDAELAVANSIAAVQAGVRHVQATINGYGERCGNANMVSDPRQPRAQDAGRARAGGRRRPRRADGAQPRRVAEIANQVPERLPALRRPVGVRAQGRRPRRGRGQGRAQLPAHRPGRGRQRGPARRLRAGRQGEHRDPRPPAGPRARGARRSARALEADQAARARGPRVRGRRGVVRAADPPPRAGLRARRSGSSTTPCSSSSAPARELLAEATVKVEVDGEVLHTAADGNGPVNALDAALRKALRAFYPVLDTVHLVDYKVRIIDGATATAARTRVIIESPGRLDDLVDDGQRHQHHRGLGARARATRSSTRSGSPAPSSGGATSATSRRPTARGRRRPRPRARPGGRGRPLMTDAPGATGARPDTPEPRDPHPARLARWTVTSGSNVKSRGAVVIGPATTTGARRPRATARSTRCSRRSTRRSSTCSAATRGSSPTTSTRWPRARRPRAR